MFEEESLTVENVQFLSLGLGSRVTVQGLALHKSLDEIVFVACFLGLGSWKASRSTEGQVIVPGLRV